MLIDDGLLPERFVKNWHISSPKTDQKWYIKYRSNFLRFKANLSRLSFDHHFESNRRNRSKIFYDIVYLFNVYAAMKVYLAIRNHFIVDYHKYRLDTFDRAVSRYNDQDLSPSQIEFKLATRNKYVSDYQAARGVCKAFGEPLLNLPYIVENAHICLEVIILVIYLPSYLSHKLVKRFDYSIIFTIISPDKLQGSINSAIRHQVNRFIVSCRNFNNLLIDRKTTNVFDMESNHDDFIEGVLDSHHSDFSERMRLIYENNLDLMMQTSRILENHKYLVRQVKLMASDGLLQPFNKRSQWLDRIANIYGKTALGTFGTVLVYQTVILLIVPTGIIMVDLETDPLDLLFLAEQFIHGGTCVTVAAFYVILIFMICVDQMHFVRELSRLIERCISDSTKSVDNYLENDRIRVYWSPYSGMVDSSHTHVRRPTIFRSPITKIPAAMVHQGMKAGQAIQDEGHGSMQLMDFDVVDKSINLSLVHTLLHYKIFVTQLRPALDSLPMFVLISMFVIFAPLIVTRLLIAYLDRSRKAMSLMLCVLILVSIDITFVMINKLYVRCLDIYKRLQSLMAHAIAIDHSVRMQIGREVYDKHLIWLLRKELSDPDRLADQFATRMLMSNWKMTYANLIKYHFWWGVLAISTMMINPSLPNAADIFGGVWHFFSEADVAVDRFLDKFSKLGKSNQ